MKRLTLMRHASAQWRDPQVADFDRPLSRRGSSEAEAMCRRLAELSFTPALILTSSARRALQTAEIVARGLGIASRSVRQEDSLYLAGAPEILSAVQGLGPKLAHIMVVGHNPGISELVHALAPAARKTLDSLATAAVCSLSFNARSWAQVRADTLKELLNESPPTRLFALWAS